MKRLSLVLAVFLVACGKSGSTSSSSSSKSLWSVWSDASGYSVDLRNGSLGTPLIFAYSVSGQIVCGCGISLAGTESSGTYAVASCIFNPLGNYTGADPGCTSLEGSGTFEHSGSTLTVCDTGGCESYH